MGKEEGEIGAEWKGDTGGEREGGRGDREGEERGWREESQGEEILRLRNIVYQDCSLGLVNK